MATAGTPGYPVLLKIDDGAGNYTTVAEVMDISGPNLTLDLQDATSHSSTAGWEEVIAGILAGGEITFSLIFLPVNATQSYTSGIIKEMVNRVKRNFKLVWSNTGATEWIFPCYVAAHSAKAPVRGNLTADVTLRVTGQPTLAG